MTSRSRFVCFPIFLLALIINGPSTTAQNMSPTPRRDINAVLADHQQELMSIPDVVGVYVALAADGKTPALKIMLKRASPEAERAIPRSIEGYPVTTEVTGEIRPFGKQ